MDNIRHYLILLSLTLCMMGCSQDRTLLSDEARNINPYKNGQKLTFASTSGTESTLKIRRVEDGRFPDGLGAFPNERLTVIADRESKTDRTGASESILYFMAKTDKEEEMIDFCISLKENFLQMKPVTVNEYRNQVTRKLSTRFGTYNDIISFHNYANRKIFEREIVEFYWSKSVGYVRLIQKDGTTWDLKSIETIDPE